MHHVIPYIKLVIVSNRVSGINETWFTGPHKIQNSYIPISITMASQIFLYIDIRKKYKSSG